MDGAGVLRPGLLLMKAKANIDWRRLILQGRDWSSCPVSECPERWGTLGRTMTLILFKRKSNK
jgi:hypothetical protein